MVNCENENIDFHISLMVTNYLQGQFLQYHLFTDDLPL